MNDWDAVSSPVNSQDDSVTDWDAVSTPEPQRPHVKRKAVSGSLPPSPPSQNVSAFLSIVRGHISMSFLIRLGLFIVVIVGLFAAGHFGVFRVAVGIDSGNAPATATAQAAVTATATVANSDYVQATSGTAVIDDPLSDNSMGFRWSVYTSSISCQFTGGGYAATVPPGTINYCYAAATNFSNFALEMQTKIIKGDCGVILFRANSANNSFYDFSICQNGLYGVGRFDGSAWRALMDGIAGYQPNSAIHQGFGQTNLVAVIARGSSFDLYVNHQRVTSFIDSAYSQGQIGVSSVGYFGDPTETVFTNLKVWTL